MECIDHYFQRSSDMQVAFPKETGSVGETSHASYSMASHNNGKLSGVLDEKVWLPVMMTLSPAPKAVRPTDSNVLKQSQQHHLSCVASPIVGPLREQP